MRPKLPFIPGSEVSGVITELGPGVKSLKLGDRVCAICMGGAFAEELVASEASVWPVPSKKDRLTHDFIKEIWVLWTSIMILMST